MGWLERVLHPCALVKFGCLPELLKSSHDQPAPNSQCKVFPVGSQPVGVKRSGKAVSWVHCIVKIIADFLQLQGSNNWSSNRNALCCCCSINVFHAYLNCCLPQVRGEVNYKPFPWRSKSIHEVQEEISGGVSSQAHHIKDAPLLLRRRPNCSVRVEEPLDVISNSLYLIVPIGFLWKERRTTECSSTSWIASSCGGCSTICL